MNLFTKQKQTHRHREQTSDCQRGGRAVREVWKESLGLADADYYIYFRMDKQQGPTL